MALVTGSQILIVGAMLVGPEYGAIVALAFGLTRRNWQRVADSAWRSWSAFSGRGSVLSCSAWLFTGLVWNLKR